MEKNININTWEELTEKIVAQFLLDYFEDSEPEYWWISFQTGGMFYYGDYYIDFIDVVSCYNLNITPEQFMNWYNYCLENESVKISLAKFITSPQEQENKCLENLKERVDFAEKEFKKSIEEYLKNSLKI